MDDMKCPTPPPTKSPCASSACSAVGCNRSVNGELSKTLKLGEPLVGESKYSATQSRTNQSMQAKIGRRLTFDHEQDVAIVRAVAAAEGHIAAFGKTLKRFEKAAAILSEMLTFSASFSCNQVQIRY